MKITYTTAAVALTLFVGAAAAQPSPKHPASEARAPAGAPAGGYNVCHEYSLAVDDALKDAGRQKAEDFLDDSAPRATMRAARLTADLASAQANVTLMIGARCPLPELPISSQVYEGAASDCHLAKTSEDVAAKCNTRDWKPGPRWEAASRPHY